MLKILPIYAALLGLLYLYLSARTIGIRRKARISIGDGGDSEMLRAIRVHANFSEYTPITLILIACMEFQGSSIWLLHTLGGLFLIARLSHAYGISSPEAPGKFRVAGMVGTLTTIGISAIWLLSNW